MKSSRCRPFPSWPIAGWGAAMSTPAHSPPCTRPTRISVAPWPGPRRRLLSSSNRTFSLASSASLPEIAWKPGRESSMGQLKPTPIAVAGCASRGRGQPHAFSGDAVGTCRLVHRFRDRVVIAVRDRDHTPASTAERGAERAALLRRRDDVVEIGIGARTARLVQPIVHSAGHQGAIVVRTGEHPLGNTGEGGGRVRAAPPARARGGG